MHYFCYGYACSLHNSAVFDPRKLRLLKTPQTPFYFENSWVVFLCKWSKTETFENDGMAAHINLHILDVRVNNNIM